ncbi:MAG: ROK family protein [Actinomycetia bacterium]|nr:ROK family protein [Actinomycetes bacterium]MCP4960373.1 ROK family protein [Actinomycetes bacterium]
MTRHTLLAVDVGGTKLEVGLVDAESGSVLTRHRAPTLRTGDAEDLLALVFDLAMATLDDAAGPAPGACGIGCGGPLSLRDRTVSPLNIAQWRRFPLASRIEERFGLVTHVDNDAKALTLAEGWLGVARGKSNYLAMVVSTGIGAGLVVDGRLLDGDDGNAGHIGHLVVVPGGREHAGIAGSLEGEASGTAIEAHTGRPASEADLTWRVRTGTLVGRAVGGVANLLDLDVAVVAGSVALGYGTDFFDSAQAEIDRVARLDHSIGTRIVPAGLGADGPLVGAAAVSLYRTGRLR